MVSPAAVEHQAVEIDRVLAPTGVVSLSGRLFTTGATRYGGQRVTLRLDGTLIKVLTADRRLIKTKPCPLDWAACRRLRGDVEPAQEHVPAAVDIRF